MTNKKERFASVPIIASLALFVFTLGFFFGFSNPNYATQSMTYTSVTFVESIVNSSTTYVESVIRSTSPGDFDLSYFLPFVASFLFLTDFVNEVCFENKDKNKLYHVFSLVIGVAEVVFMAIFLAKFHDQYHELLTGSSFSLRIMSALCIGLLLIFSLAYRLYYMQNKVVPFKNNLRLDGSIMLSSGLVYLSTGLYLFGVGADSPATEGGLAQGGAIIYVVLASLLILVASLMLFVKDEIKILAKVARYYIFAVLIASIITFIFGFNLDESIESKAMIGWFNSFSMSYFVYSLVVTAIHLLLSPNSLLAKDNR